MTEIIEKIVEVIQQLDAKSADNEYLDAVQWAVTKAVLHDQPLNFVIFTCPMINSEYLFSETPWRCVSIDPKGNNLVPDLPRVADVIQELKKLYPLVQLKILIGNTDPYFVYLQQFMTFSKGERGGLLNKFNVRWEAYRENFERWTREIALVLNPEVISWYRFLKEIEAWTEASFEVEYELATESIASYFAPDRFERELQILRTQFGPGKYFEKLEQPDEALLKDWIIRKFAQYAVQGKWIYENIPNAILIQNEKPSDLRSQMYQPLVREKYQMDFPIVYFLDVDNSG